MKIGFTTANLGICAAALAFGATCVKAFDKRNSAGCDHFVPVIFEGDPTRQ